MSKDLQKTLAQVLDHNFKNTGLLEVALTHSSTGAEKNYERLEFLGDRVLGLVIAETLFQEFPNEAEGDLAKRLASLVQGKTIASVAREIDLGSLIKFSAAERAAGGADNDSILADGLEALLGVLYLDAGLEKTKPIIQKLWGDRVRTMTDPPQDPKTALQERAQAKGLSLPVYEIVNREGPDHAPVFTIRVTVEGFPPQEATGVTRRKAEKSAAALLLEKIESRNK